MENKAMLIKPCTNFGDSAVYLLKLNLPSKTLEILVFYNNRRGDFEGLNSVPPQKDIC